MGMNVWGQPLKKDEDLFSQTFENPEAPEIDNKPGFMAQLVQGFLKAGATAAGGAAGGAAADAVSNSYNASQEMPATGNITQQQMATTPTLNLQGPLADNSTMTASYNPDGMEMDKRIYDDFIIKDLLEQGIILPSEIQDIKRDGYKQLNGPLMGVA